MHMIDMCNMEWNLNACIVDLYLRDTLVLLSMLCPDLDKLSLCSTFAITERKGKS